MFKDEILEFFANVLACIVGVIIVILCCVGFKSCFVGLFFTQDITLLQKITYWLGLILIGGFGLFVVGCALHGKKIWPYNMPKKRIEEEKSTTTNQFELFDDPRW